MESWGTWDPGREGRDSQEACAGPAAGVWGQPWENTIS